MAIKDAKTTVDFIRASQNSSNLPSLLASSQTDLATWGSQINSDLQSLLAVKNTIDSSARQIRDKTETLAKLEAGADALDVRSQALALQQKEIAYQDYFIRAPFEGVLAKLSIGKNETVSGGTSIGVFIAKQKVADISLNEVDVAKVKIGQPVTLTFDAVDGLTLTGKVVEVDLVGTVSSGVVNYNVKIAFDVDDARVRSGMSVSASIITDTRPDVLIVPSSAVKSQGNTSYVEVLMGDFASSTGSVGVTSATAPEQRVVEVGVSNDSDVEIVSGLKEGEQVVTKTTTGTTATTKTTKTQSATSLLRSAGGGPGGR
jgi:HlyD family secretion protein